MGKIGVERVNVSFQKAYYIKSQKNKKKFDFSLDKGQKVEYYIVTR